MDFANYWFSNEQGENPNAIGESLRNNGTEYLIYSDGVTGGNPTTFTLSTWMKWEASANSTGTIIGTMAYVNGGYDYRNILQLTNNYGLNYYSGDFASTPSYYAWVDTLPNIFRDPGAWYHIVCAVDTNETNPEDRIKLFVNGERLSTRGVPYPGQGQLQFFNNTNYVVGMGVGCVSSYPQTSANFGALNGYLSSTYFIDGQALDPTNFGSYDNSGVWTPLNYTGTFGTTGYHLTYNPTQNPDPNVGIGIDSSGNGNNFTSTGFEVTDTSSTAYDLMQDSPTQNWATLNPLDTGWWYWRGSPSSAGATGTLGYANLSSNTNSSGHTVLTQYPQPGKKLYLEYTCGGVNAPGSGAFYVGFIPQNQNPVGTRYLGGPDNVGSVGFYRDGTIWVNGASIGSCAGFSNSENVGLAYDVDTGNVWQARNGVWYNGGDPATGTNPTYTLSADILYSFAFNEYGNGDATKSFVNAGQQPLKYDIPTGFTTPVSDNMPAAPITTGIDGFRALTAPGADIRAVGNGTSTNGTNWNETIHTGFTSGLWLIKDTINSNQWQFLDSVRGGDNAIQSPSDDVFPYAAPSGNSVCYTWEASDDFTSTDGTISSSGKRNLQTGFSIIYYQGNGQLTGSIGHGLNKAPTFSICKGYSDTWAFQVASTAFDMSSGGMRLETQESYRVLPSGWQDEYTSTTISLVSGASNAGNVLANNQNYIVYCWTEIPGYSSFGRFDGNGQTQGAFVYTGFQPAFILVKAINGTSDWYILDTTREPLNPASDILQPNRNDPQTATTAADTDFLCNGFKCRGTGNSFNKSGDSYLYAAFAQYPFGGENVAPATAH
jgi:hypothetical protein